MDKVSFFSLWLAGYLRPSRFVEQIGGLPSPRFGLYGALGRAAADSLLLYLPLALMGRAPSTPSYLTFLPTDRYYGALVLMGPAVLLGQWLLLNALVYLILRLSGRPGDIEKLFNLSGMSVLVVGAVLVPWDWLWLALGWHSPELLGISHLVLDLWGVFLMTLGLKRLLGIPVRLGLLLNVLWILGGLPLAMVFMRAPL